VLKIPFTPKLLLLLSLQTLRFFLKMSRAQINARPTTFLSRAFKTGSRSPQIPLGTTVVTLKDTELHAAIS
jgi:hypothetical protein